MPREPVEVVQQRLVLAGVDLDRVRGRRFRGPVRAEDEDGLRGWGQGGDFAADRLELGEDRVRGVVHRVRTAVGEEVDWCSVGLRDGWGVGGGGTAVGRRGGHAELLLAHGGEMVYGGSRRRETMSDNGRARQDPAEQRHDCCGCCRRYG